MDPNTRIFNNKQIFHEITGINRETNACTVISTLCDTGHLDPSGFLNFIWTPGASRPVPGYKNDTFKPYSTTITIIGAEGATLLTRDARWGCQELLKISQPAQNAPFALKFKHTGIYQPIQIMRDTHLAAHKARFPSGNHILTNQNTSDHLKNPTYPWTSPDSMAQRSVSSSITTSATADSYTEKFTAHDSQIAMLRGMFNTFSQRVGNLEVDAAANNSRLTEISKISRDQDRSITDIKTILKETKDSNTALASKLDQIFGLLINNATLGGTPGTE